MRIGIFGTGSVGTTLGSRLVGLGHEVCLGSRAAGNEKAKAWVAATGERASAGTFAEAASFGALLINATSGSGSLAALQAAGETNLGTKALIDVSNPLDFSKGMPPTLSICNTDSLGEQLQRAFPKVRVVKALNTVNARLMAHPRELADGEHELLMCGNDAAAKAEVKALLESFGWKHFLDLGDITSARGTEMYLPLWLRLWGSLKTAALNVRVVR